MNRSLNKTSNENCESAADSSVDVDEAASEMTIKQEQQSKLCDITVN